MEKTITYIEKANHVHKNKYDYSQLKYINYDIKVRIICNVHGEFLQLPSSHLMGFGCPKCGSENSKIKRCLGKETFCKRANILYENKYDYSLVEYLSEKKTIKIICPKHGEFTTTPQRHLLRKTECPICSGHKKNNEMIINEFKMKHGVEYDYSLVNYINNQKKVKIICQVHGEFEQTPANHLSGTKCPICSTTKRAENRKYDKNIFINKASIKHGNKYDYSSSDYISSKTKIKIICPIHGEFEQIAANHLNGQGCIKCGTLSASTIKSKTNDLFILTANLKHQSSYDYSLTNYSHSQKKVKIICPIHGAFEQIAANHLMGAKCPKCSESKGEIEIRRLLENNKINFISQKTFEKCVGKIKKLPFDFYLPDENILIEYNGMQHYMEIKYFGGKITFERIKKCDAIKREFAKKNNIKLIEIKYNTKNIREILINENIIK